MFELYQRFGAVKFSEDTEMAGESSLLPHVCAMKSCTEPTGRQPQSISADGAGGRLQHLGA